MNRAPGRVVMLVAGALALSAAAAVIASREPAASPDAARPTLLLLTSLPLMFGDTLSLEAAGSPALDALSERFDVQAISTSSAAALARGRLLLMAHPLPQPAEDLVALDQWVRGGGRVMLLADPLLDWPDHRPLGDNTRPPPMFMDTGLLGHWGLTLAPPDGTEGRQVAIAGRTLTVRSAGRLSGKCRIADDGLLADCAIGKGRAVVIADADLLNPDGPGGRAGMGAVVDELGALAAR